MTTETEVGIVFRNTDDAVAIGIRDTCEFRFARTETGWGMTGLFVRTAEDRWKLCLHTRYWPSFLGRQMYESLPAEMEVREKEGEAAVTFTGPCLRPVPHRLRAVFRVRKGCPFIERLLEFIPETGLELGTGDLACTLQRNRSGYFDGRLILGFSPLVGRTPEAPRWYDERLVQAFSKDVNVDRFDMVGIPAIVAANRGENPFNLVYLKELPPRDPLRHLIAETHTNEGYDEIGAASTRCRVAAGQMLRDRSFWRAYYDPEKRMEDLIPEATSAYWDVVETYPDHKLDAPAAWMQTSGKVVDSLLRTPPFGDGDNGYAAGLLFQYWGDYLFRFTRLKEQRHLRDVFDLHFEKALAYLRGDSPWARSYWTMASGKACATFFTLERLRCGLPVAHHWQDTELLDLYRGILAPFVDAGEHVLDAWREEAARLEREHAALEVNYFQHFPGTGWAYAAAGNMALASELDRFAEIRDNLRGQVAVMVRRLNRELRLLDMNHYKPRAVYILPIGWSVYANVRAYEFTGDASFLDAAWLRLHWILSMGQFREIDDDRTSCRPVRDAEAASTPAERFRWRGNCPRLDATGWLYSGTDERWHAPSEMWQMVPLLAPLLELRPDPTALRFLALARRTMVSVFPAVAEEDPDFPEWIPFEFPLARKDREWYGTGPFFQAAMVFEGFARPDNGKVLAFSPTTLYGGRCPASPRVVFHNPTGETQAFAPRFAEYGTVSLREIETGKTETYGGGELELRSGASLVAELSGNGAEAD